MAAGFVWDIDPAVFSFMPLPRWYSLMFASGIVIGYLVMRSIFLKENKSIEMLDSLLVHIIVGMVVGMRLGHCLFYQPDEYLSQPWRIPMIWEGGYASHGGFFGVIISMLFFIRKYPDVTFAWLADRMCIICMVAAAFIRFGNFFNSEMIGHPAEGLPWAIIFAKIDNVPRHPAQLYEGFGYLAIFGIAYALFRHGKILAREGKLFGVIMILGFGWRFFCEFFKEDQVPFEQGMTINMGQILSLPFMVVGLVYAVGLVKTKMLEPTGQRP